MNLSWEIINNEIGRYITVLNIRSKCTIALVEDFREKCAERDAERDRHTKLVSSSVTGLAFSSTSRVEALPGDNFDLGLNAAAGVVLSGALTAPGAIINGIYGYLQHKEEVAPRPFISSPGSHEGFESLAKENSSRSPDLKVLSDVGRALSFVFDSRLVEGTISSILRSEKLLKLIDIELLEGARCGGPEHPFTSAVRTARKEGIDPWKDNATGLSESAALALLDRATKATGWKPVDRIPDFGTWFDSHPTFDGFWLIAAFQAKRLETALHELARGILHEAWSCPVEPQSPDPVSRELHWDFMTEKESFTERGARNPGAGHPGVEKLGDAVYDLELKRRAMTSELPPKFSNMARTYPDLPDLDISEIAGASTLPREATAETMGWGGGLVSFRKKVEQERKQGEPEKSNSSRDEVMKGFEKYLGEEPVLKHYGDMRAVSDAILWKEPELMPLFQPLRSTDYREWWSLALEMRKGREVEMVPVDNG